MRRHGESELRGSGETVPTRKAHPTCPARALAPWFLLALPVAVPSDWAANAQPAALVRDALLIDGSSSNPLSRIDILIEGGRIAGIGPTGSLELPDGAVFLDASGKTVIPGIVNIRGLAGLVRSPERPQNHFHRSEALAQLGTYAAYGVTTTATLGPDGAVLVRIRQDVDSGSIRSAARVMTPIRVLTVSAPKATRFPGLGPVFQVVGSPEEGHRAVDRLVEEGADYVEFWDGSGNSRSDNESRIPIAIVERASHHGLRVMIVTSKEESASRLVRAGAKVVGSSITDTDVSQAFVSSLIASNAVYAPALSAEAVAFEYGEEPTWLDDRYLRRSSLSGVTGLLRGPWKMRQALDPDRALKIHRFDTARRNLRRLEAAGVTIGLASASGFPGTFEGFSDYLEAVRMKRAGMSAASVIRAFSSGSATALGIDRERGALKPGHLADLVILNANPLENIHNLRELHAVFIGGQLAKL